MNMSKTSDQSPSKKERKGHGGRKSGVSDHPGGETAGDGLALNAKQGIKQIHSVGDPVAHNKAHETGAAGLARILEPAKNADEFAKGTVGKPSELDAIRDDGDQGDMGEETLLYGGGYFEREKAGLEDGISLRETADIDSTEPNFNYDIDPLTGSAPERKIGRTNNYEVSGKRGNKFLIGEM
jgi:hypothetical protein